MNTGDPRITWVQAWIEERLDRPLRVGDMAHVVNLSASQFTRVFRAATGQSPARYVHVRRLERARVLLETTFLTVKEVMGQVGMNDPSHFTRDFARQHGVTPGRLRAARQRPPPAEMPRGA